MKLCILICLLLITIPCFPQDLVSTYKPKTETEKLVIAKLKSLSEIKNRPLPSGKASADIMIDPPDSANRCYRFQVGFDYPDRFATSYWLSVDPKTLQVYYEDFDGEGVQDITLEKWRYWRKRPEFQKIHKWVNGKIVVLEDKKHAKTKSRQT